MVLGSFLIGCNNTEEPSGSKMACNISTYKYCFDNSNTQMSESDLKELCGSDLYKGTVIESCASNSIGTCTITADGAGQGSVIHYYEGFVDDDGRNAENNCKNFIPGGVWNS